jgi:hypothetical protein
VPAISPALRRLYRLHRLHIEGDVEDLLQDTFCASSRPKPAGASPLATSAPLSGASPIASP